MAQKKVFELKVGDIITTYGEKAVITNLEHSGKGIKQGNVKFRIEAESVNEKKPLTIIRLAEDLIDIE